jgi:23S rRNA pseudouridine1911/1915/1917 synthase
MECMVSRGELSGADYSAAIEQLIPDEYAGLRLDQALVRMFPEHSRSRLQSWLRTGRVTVDAARAESKRKVWGGERIAFTPISNEIAGHSGAESIALAIVHEDEAILVVDKPAGLVVHPGAGNRSGTLANALLAHAAQLSDVPRAGIVHRLDKDTTGLLVVAKTLAAQTDLVRQLAARRVTREYIAVVHGVLASAGEIDAPIGRHPIARTRMAVNVRGKPARTRYRVLERLKNATAVTVSLDTGRTHQIRVHMRAIGHPLIGDPTYGLGGKPPIDFHRQALHAARLALVHPARGTRVEWTSPLPADMRALIETLRR